MARCSANAPSLKAAIETQNNREKTLRRRMTRKFVAGTADEPEAPWGVPDRAVADARQALPLLIIVALVSAAAGYTLAPQQNLQLLES